MRAERRLTEMKRVMGWAIRGQWRRIDGIETHSTYVYKTVKTVLTLKVVEASEQEYEPLNYMIDKLHAM